MAFGFESNKNKYNRRSRMGLGAGFTYIIGSFQGYRLSG